MEPVSLLVLTLGALASSLVTAVAGWFAERKVAQKESDWHER